MTPDQIFVALSGTEGLPREAMAAAGQRRDEMIPVFLEHIEHLQSAGAETVTEEDFSRFLFVFYLLGEWRDARAYRPLATLLRRDPALLDELLGDAITEGCSRVVAGVCDGDLQPIFEVIEDEAAAAAIFVFNYAKTDVVRARSTVAYRRSWVERSDEETRRLARVGHACVVLELFGFLFFGTADKLARLAKAELGAGLDIRYLLFDFGRVAGLDASASASLVEVVRAARSAGVEVTFCAVSPGLERQLRLALPQQEKLRFNGTINAELERVEDALLTETCIEEPIRMPRLLEVVHRLEKEFEGRPDIIRRVPLLDGQELLKNGVSSNELYVVSSGKLRAEVPADGGGRRIVAKFRVGALIGEVSYYAGVKRTASVVADMAGEVVRIDLRPLDRFPTLSVLDFHKAAAEAMARRVMRMTEQVHEIRPRSD